MQRIDVSNWSGEKEIVLDREGMDVQITGAFELHENEKISLKLIIRHIAPRTSANTILKGIVFDNAVLELDGTIIVENAAKQTNSFLRENILLLSPHAKAEAIPNLEILTDDVKCSHAATISSFPEEHIFYLQSRGLSKKQAQILLADGFLSEVDSARKKE